MTIKTANSAYQVNIKDRTITGGIFQDSPKKFKKLSCMVGTRAVFYMEDGTFITTSTVQAVA